MEEENFSFLFIVCPIFGKSNIVTKLVQISQKNTTALYKQRLNTERSIGTDVMNEYRNPGNDNVTAPRSNQSQRKNCPNQKTALEDLFRFAYFFFWKPY